MSPVRCATGRVSLLLALTLAGSSLGCAAASHVEEYSLVIRKRAHSYEPVSPAQAQAAAVLSQSSGTGSTPNAPGGAGPVNPSGLGVLEPFKPFAYCTFHQSCHWLESTEAVTLAPAQYPVALGTTLSVLAVASAVEYAGEIWSWLFPSEDRSLPVPERRQTTDR